MSYRSAIFVIVLGLAGCSREPSPPEPSTQRAQQPSPPRDQPSEVVATDPTPTTNWDPSTSVSADFNADGLTDEAAVGYVSSDAIELAVDIAKPDGPRARQVLRFGIGQSQDAICATPAALEVEKVYCSGDGAGELPGCRESDRPSGLALSGGDCDAIHLYWDHEHNQMAWWRN